MAEKKVEKKKSKGREIFETIFTILFGVIFVFLAIAQVDGMIHKKDNFGQTLRFGWGSFIVQTDSMEPDYMVDSAIITYKENPEKIYEEFMSGKTIDLTFQDCYATNVRPQNCPTLTNQTNNSLTYTVMTHRLREIQVDNTKEIGEGRYTYIVSGINIAGHLSAAGQYQACTEAQLIGVVKSNSKFIGGLLNFLSSVWGLLIVLLIPAGYLVVTSVMDIFKAYNLDEDEPVAGNASTGTDSSGVNLNSGSGDLSGLSEKDKERLKQEMLDELLGKNKD